jgi:hypothetical protein
MDASEADGVELTRRSADPQHAVKGVYVEHVELLFGLINDRLAPVFTANRFFEEHTGIANKAGANNLTEALSHIGTLIEYAREMDFNEQREQVALFGDHKWSAWDAGAKCFADACEKSNEWEDALRQCIGAAEQYRAKKQTVDLDRARRRGSRDRRGRGDRSRVRVCARQTETPPAEPGAATPRQCQPGAGARRACA